MSEWFPIESAPKDGTKIDIWVPAWGRRVPDCVWCEAWETKYGFKVQEHWFHDIAGGEYCDRFVNPGAPIEGPDVRGIATHWMPLPEPPAKDR